MWHVPRRVRQMDRQAADLTPPTHVTWWSRGAAAVRDGHRQGDSIVEYLSSFIGWRDRRGHMTGCVSLLCLTCLWRMMRLIGWFLLSLWCGFEESIISPPHRVLCSILPVFAAVVKFSCKRYLVTLRQNFHLVKLRKYQGSLVKRRHKDCTVKFRKRLGYSQNLLRWAQEMTPDAWHKVGPPVSWGTVVCVTLHSDPIVHFSWHICFYDERHLFNSSDDGADGFIWQIH